MLDGYRVVPKGLITSLGFLGNAEFSPWKRLPEFIALRKSYKSLRVFLWQPVTIFCVCVYGFVWKKNVCAIPARINTSLNNRINFRPTVAKNQGNQFSQYSDVTNGWLLSSSAYFPWNMILKYKMKLSEGSWDKVLYSKLMIQCFWNKEICFLVVCLLKR